MRMINVSRTLDFGVPWPASLCNICVCIAFLVLWSLFSSNMAKKTAITHIYIAIHRLNTCARVLFWHLLSLLVGQASVVRIFQAQKPTVGKLPGSERGNWCGNRSIETTQCNNWRIRRQTSWCYMILWLVSNLTIIGTVFLRSDKLHLEPKIKQHLEPAWTLHPPNRSFNNKASTTHKKNYIYIYTYIHVHTYIHTLHTYIHT